MSSFFRPNMRRTRSAQDAETTKSLQAKRAGLAPPAAVAEDKTPGLSPSNTLGGPSPAFSTTLESPALDAFDLDAAKATTGTAPKAKPQAQASAAKAVPLPECWGHRGASATYPENTKLSFIEACKVGAQGIETDIHVTADKKLVLFHDPELGRTTNGKGRIRDQPWEGVLEHVRTKAEPSQPIPLFTDVLDVLLQPENLHVKLNLDCKVDSEPQLLFPLIKAVIESYPDWQTLLAPRIVLGLWHPKFLEPAIEHLAYLPRYAITMSISQSRTYFFPLVHGFSVYYSLLASPEGQRFLRDCRAAGKGVCCWTVNGVEEMRDCARWEVDCVITDKPALWAQVKREIQTDRVKALRPTVKTLLNPYVNLKNYWFNVSAAEREETLYLEGQGGKFAEVDLSRLERVVERVVPRDLVI